MKRKWGWIALAAAWGAVALTGFVFCFVFVWKARTYVSPSREGLATAFGMLGLLQIALYAAAGAATALLWVIFSLLNAKRRPLSEKEKRLKKSAFVCLSLLLVEFLARFPLSLFSFSLAAAEIIVIALTVGFLCLFAACAVLLVRFAAAKNERETPPETKPAEWVENSEWRDLHVALTVFFSIVALFPLFSFPSEIRHFVRAVTESKSLTFWERLSRLAGSFSVSFVALPSLFSVFFHFLLLGPKKRTKRAKRGKRAAFVFIASSHFACGFLLLRLDHQDDYPVPEKQIFFVLTILFAAVFLIRFFLARKKSGEEEKEEKGEALHQVMQYVSVSLLLFWASWALWSPVRAIRVEQASDFLQKAFFVAAAGCVSAVLSLVFHSFSAKNGTGKTNAILQNGAFGALILQEILVFLSFAFLQLCRFATVPVRKSLAVDLLFAWGAVTAAALALVILCRSGGKEKENAL